MCINNIIVVERVHSVALRQQSKRNKTFTYGILCVHKSIPNANTKHRLLFWSVFKLKMFNYMHGTSHKRLPKMIFTNFKFLFFFIIIILRYYHYLSYFDLFVLNTLDVLCNKNKAIQRYRLF